MSVFRSKVVPLGVSPTSTTYNLNEPSNDLGSGGEKVIDHKTKVFQLRVAWLFVHRWHLNNKSVSRLDALGTGDTMSPGSERRDDNDRVTFGYSEWTDHWKCEETQSVDVEQRGEQSCVCIRMIDVPSRFNPPPKLAAAEIGGGLAFIRGALLALAAAISGSSSNRKISPHPYTILNSFQFTSKKFFTPMQDVRMPLEEESHERSR